MPGYHSRRLSPRPRARALPGTAARRGRRRAARLAVIGRAPPDKAVWEAELRRAKLDALKELAYGASHEINNPLANIALRAQTLLKRESDPEKRKLIEAMRRGAMRAHEMISDLMLFARPPAPRPEPTRGDELLRAVADEHRPLAEELGVRLLVDEPLAATVVYVDPTQIGVALAAAVRNALEAIDRAGDRPGGEVVLACRTAADGRLALVVRDNGPGVPASILPHVFDPFFSGREAGRGLGFGLSKCWRLVTQQGGEVRLESAPPAGTTLTITLPRATLMNDEDAPRVGDL